MKQLLINDVPFNVQDVAEFTTSEEEVGLEKRILNNGEKDKQIHQVKFSFSVLGEKEYHLYDSFFGNTHFNVVLPETNETFIATNVSHSTFYQGSEVSDNTEVVFKVTLSKS
ncbi:hypothetical protein V7134_17990 [Priestia megaterium]|uniref:hypothetical protein n=1 Tax=Priestia megaterium TaxID=1404 RepID=UPI002FFF8267